MLQLKGTPPLKKKKPYAEVLRCPSGKKFQAVPMNMTAIQASLNAANS